MSKVGITNQEKINKLNCFVLPGHIRDCQPEYLELYNQAYRFWHEFMGKEMESEKLTDIESKLSSDGFMLFKDIYILCYENNEDSKPSQYTYKHPKQQTKSITEIVGLFCFDDKDVTSPAVLGQSYFKAYPKDILEQYIMQATSIMTIGHLLVHPQWRRKQIGIGLSDILVWFMHKRFAESGTDLMIYFTRNNRGTDDLGIKFGGTAILEHYNYGGLDAHIIATKPQDIIMDCGTPEINWLSELLWDNRINCNLNMGKNNNRTNEDFKLSNQIKPHNRI